MPNIAKLLLPLYHSAKDGRLKWNQTEKNPFEKSKYAVARTPVLNHAIEFRSRTLSNVDVKYSQLEGEGLTLVFRVQRVWEYLLGCTFTLVTDHKALLGLLREDSLTPLMAAARTQRWTWTLGAYRYRISSTSQ